MSERGVLFIERWIAENISTEPFLEGGSDAGSDAHAQDALRAAEKAGIPAEEILEEFPDLAFRMSEAIQGAADSELRRQIDDDD